MDVPIDKWGREITTVKAKSRTSLRNTLTELRPLVPSDNTWIEKRREYLESVDGREYFSDEEDAQGTEPSVEDIVRATVEAARKAAREKAESDAAEASKDRRGGGGNGGVPRVLSNTNRPQTYHGSRAVFGKESSVTIPLFGKGGGANFAEAKAFPSHSLAPTARGPVEHFPSRPSSRAYSSRPSSRTPSEASSQAGGNRGSNDGVVENAAEIETDEIAVVPVKVAAESVKAKQSKEEHVLSVRFFRY